MPPIDLRSSTSLAALSALFLAAAGNITGPPLGVTGAPALGTFPPELTCAQSGCHLGNPPQTGGALSILGLPAEYTPGTAYPLTVRLESTAQTSVTRRWGFEITAVRHTDGRGAGAFSAPGLRLVTNGVNGRRYVTHEFDDVQSGEPGPVEWSFTWTAPAVEEGPVGFYAAGNAANGDVTSLGDFIYTTSAVVPADPVPVLRTTWGALKAGRFAGRTPDRNR